MEKASLEVSSTVTLSAMSLGTTTPFPRKIGILLLMMLFITEWTGFALPTMKD